MHYFVAHLVMFSSFLQEDGVRGPIRKEFFQNEFLLNMNGQSAGCSPQSEGGRLQFTCRDRAR